VTIPLIHGFLVERKNVTPAIVINFIIEEKIFNLSDINMRYLDVKKQNSYFGPISRSTQS